MNNNFRTKKHLLNSSEKTVVKVDAPKTTVPNKKNKWKFKKENTKLPYKKRRKIPYYKKWWYKKKKKKRAQKNLKFKRWQNNATPLRFLSKFRIFIYFLKRSQLTKKKKTRKTWKHKIVIKITSNNVFCSLIDFSQSTKKVIKTASAGQYKIKITKKRLRWAYIPFLKKFLSKVWPLLTVGGIMVFITARIRFRKHLAKLVAPLKYYQSKSKGRKGRAFLIKFNRKKCFNGCRSPKKRRKKRKGLRLTK